MADAGMERPVPGVKPEALRRLLHPRSIAVVGASDDPASIGGAPLALLRRFGYRGDVYLVSRTRKEVNGAACLESIDDLPDGVDVVVLCVPKAAATGAVEAAGRRSVGGAVVFTAGYAEVGAGGRGEQVALAELAGSYGVALAGPNCLGLVNFWKAAPLTFGDISPNRRSAGRGAAVLAQSGAMALAMAYAAQAQDIPLSYMISTGNEAVVGVEDYLRAVLEDDTTAAVALLVEQIRRPKEFRSLAVTAREKGVALCVLHAGRGKRGRAASMSHTGALAGEQGPLRAVLGREGVLFIDSLDELIDALGLFCKNALPQARGVAFMTDSGAAKTLAIDTCEELGLFLPELSPRDEERLAAELPPFATPGNPADITAMGLNDPSLYGRVLQVLGENPEVGALVVSAMPGSERQGAEQIGAVLPVARGLAKPVVYTIAGGESPLPETNKLAIWDAGIPLFRSPERALKAVKNVDRYATSVRAAGSRRPARELLPPAPLHGTGQISERAAKELLHEAGLSIPRSRLAHEEEEAREAAIELGFPVVLKVVSPDILHKTEVGGVARVGSDAELEGAFRRCLTNVAQLSPDARVEGVLVEEAVLGGVEMLVGARRDRQWGPYLVVGLGGTWAEVLADRVLISAEAGEGEITEAISGLKAFALLNGARGQSACDLEALVSAAATLAALLRASPSLIELEVNPLVVLEKGAVVLDAVVNFAAGISPQG